MEICGGIIFSAKYFPFFLLMCAECHANGKKEKKKKKMDWHVEIQNVAAKTVILFKL